MKSEINDLQKQTIHLTPPSQETRGDYRNRKKLIAIIAILLCLLFGILLYGVLVLLPEHVSNPLPPAPPTVEEVSISKATNSIKTSEMSTSSLLLEKEAESALTDFLNLQSNLESEKIWIWGGDIYKAVLLSLSKGDNHFKQHEYEAARKIYIELTTKLKNLSHEKQAIFKNSLVMGQKSLEEKNSTEAETQFTIALAIDDNSQKALKGLKRAQNLDHVQELLKTGHTLEIENQLDQALDYYRQAHQLDKLSKEAETAYTKLQSILIERDFKTAIASFYQALQHEKYIEAERSLKNASNLRPKDLVTTQAREALQLKIKNNQLKELQVLGERLSKEEKWSQAIEIYNKALLLSPHADFAVRGKENAGSNKLVNDKFDTLLHSLPKLQEDLILQNAEDLLAYCSSLKSIGPKLSNKLSTLSLAVNNAKKIIVVTLFSDNMTDVAIYHVGRLGKFNQKRLDLRPGKYTIVAQRPGYRNTRIEVVLNHDTEEQNFTILCKDPI